MNQGEARSNKPEGRVAPALRRPKSPSSNEVHQTAHLELNPVTPATLRARRRKVAGSGARIAVLLIFFMAMISATHVVVRQAFKDNDKFVLRTITIQTEGLLDKSEIHRVMGLVAGESLLEVSLVEVRQRIEAMPQVKQARLARKYPGELVVTVDQRYPLAWVERLGAGAGEQELVLIDKEGVILPQVEKMTLQHLPVFQVYSKKEFVLGQAFESLALEQCLTWYQNYQANDLALKFQVHSVLANKPYMLSVRFTEDFVVTFPLEDHEFQLGRLSKLLAQVEMQNLAIETVDLLVEEFVPVTLKPKAVQLTPSDYEAIAHVNLSSPRK